jgi:hypothetical protein
MVNNGAPVKVANPEKYWSLCNLLQVQKDDLMQPNETLKASVLKLVHHFYSARQKAEVKSKWKLVSGISLMPSVGRASWEKQLMMATVVLDYLGADEVQVLLSSADVALSAEEEVIDSDALVSEAEGSAGLSAQALSLEAKDMVDVLEDDPLESLELA